VGTVQSDQSCAQIVTQDVVQGHGQGLKYGHLGTQTAARCRNLKTDETGTDDDDTDAGRDPLPQTNAVVEGPQGEYTVHVTLDRPLTSSSSAGNDQTVERDFLPVGQRQRPTFEVDMRGLHTEPQLDRHGSHVRRIYQGSPSRVPLAGKDLLRQRRAVVGQMGFHPQEDELVVVTVVAKSPHRTEPRH
jgi:hypothetical protein